MMLPAPRQQLLPEYMAVWDVSHKTDDVQKPSDLQPKPLQSLSRQGVRLQHKLTSEQLLVLFFDRWKGRCNFLARNEAGVEETDEIDTAENSDPSGVGPAGSPVPLVLRTCFYTWRDCRSKRRPPDGHPGGQYECAAESRALDAVHKALAACYAPPTSRRSKRRGYMGATCSSVHRERPAAIPVSPGLVPKTRLSPRQRRFYERLAAAPAPRSEDVDPSINRPSVPPLLLPPSLHSRLSIDRLRRDDALGLRLVLLAAREDAEDDVSQGSSLGTHKRLVIPWTS